MKLCVLIFCLLLASCELSEARTTKRRKNKVAEKVREKRNATASHVAEHVNDTMKDVANVTVAVPYGIAESPSQVNAQMMKEMIREIMNEQDSKTLFGWFRSIWEVSPWLAVLTMILGLMIICLIQRSGDGYDGHFFVGLRTREQQGASTGASSSIPRLNTLTFDFPKAKRNREVPLNTIEVRVKCGGRTNTIYVGKDGLLIQFPVLEHSVMAEYPERT